MGGCNKMDGKKMKAGWIGFLREEPDIWKSVEKLSALGYRGLEGGDFLLVGDVDENRKRLADLNLQVLTTSAGMEEIREGRYADAIRTAHQLGTSRVTVWSCAVNNSFAGKETSYDEVMRDFAALEKAAVAMEHEGLTLCYHNHYQDFVLNFHETPCFDLMMANTEKLHIELDIGWVTNGLRDPVEVMRQIAPRLAAIHVKDYLKGEWREKEAGWAPIFTSVGNGELKLAPALQAASELGVEWAVVEQDQMHNLSAMESLTAAYLNMKETGYVL